MRNVCTDFECDLLAFDGEDDQPGTPRSPRTNAYPPKVAISTLVNSLKGVSARLIRKENLPEVRRALWGSHFWSPSYCAVSCGGAPLRPWGRPGSPRYVESQRDPHRDKQAAKRRTPAKTTR